MDGRHTHSEWWDRMHGMANLMCLLKLRRHRTYRIDDEFVVDL